MSAIRRMDLADVVAVVMIVAAAAGIRVWYLNIAADAASTSGPIQLQDAWPTAPSDSQPRGRATGTELDVVVGNLTKESRFAARPPFAQSEEETAHFSPGYPFFLSLLERVTGDADKTDRLARWIQAGFGALTAGLYYIIALIGFRSRVVALLAGLFTAVHPFWIVNTAALDDGTTATFLLALTLFFGTRSGLAGGSLTSLLFGLSLAALALVRAALLPFSIVGLLWFMLRSRSVPRGWLCGTVAFLGFVIGFTPWTLRNWNLFQEPVPVVDSRYTHFWMSYNPRATGGPMSEKEMLDAMVRDAGDTEGIALQRRMNEHPPLGERHRILAEAMHRAMHDDPAACIRSRISAALSFFFGSSFIKHPENWATGTLMVTPNRYDPLPAWLGDKLPLIFYGSTLGILLLALLGWRWTYAWRRESRLLALAAVFVPLPYILSHAESLVGPRLPLDGVLLTFAAFALACIVPGVGTSLLEGPEAVEEDTSAGRRLHEDKPHVRF
jgi:4-amino-4-deoxy-L-arabinose transferase-like glycosyltransferase